MYHLQASCTLCDNSAILLRIRLLSTPPAIELLTPVPSKTLLKCHLHKPTTACIRIRTGNSFDYLVLDLPDMLSEILKRPAR